MRKTLNKIQTLKLSDVKELTVKQIREQSWNFQDLYKILIGGPNPVENYKFIVSNYSSMVDDVMHALGSEFIDWIEENAKDKIQAIPSIVVSVADHQSKRSLCIDPIISLCSLVFQIQKFINV